MLKTSLTSPRHVRCTNTPELLLLWALRRVSGDRLEEIQCLDGTIQRQGLTEAYLRDSILAKVEIFFLFWMTP